jgi:integrase
MIDETIQEDINSLFLATLKGGKAMKGRAYHNKWVCKQCKRGDKNTILHKHYFIQICLPYLRTKPFSFCGPEKGKPFENGMKAWSYLDKIQEAVADKSFIPWNYRNQVNSICRFGNFYEKFKADKYPYFSKHLQPLFDIEMSKIDRIVVKKFYRNLSPNLKTSTKNNILTLVKSTLNDAYREGILDYVPAFPRMEKAEKAVKHWLTREEQLKVIGELPERLKLLFLFLAYHGKRINEALSLKWENIDFKRKVFRIYESKVKNEQWLPLHDAFFKALPVVGTINKTGKIFDIPWTVTLNRQLKEACKRAGVQKVTTHEFGRHSFVSQGLALGLTAEQIALITNNLSSISAYSHMNLENMRKIINSL